MSTALDIMKRPLGRPRYFRGHRYLRTNRWLTDLYFVTAQIEGIIAGNFLLVRGLEIAALEAPRPHVRGVISRLAEDLASGLALSESMRRMDRFFPPWYVDLVRAGEATGQLGRALDSIAERVWEHRAWSEKLTMSAKYVGAVLLVQVGMVLFLLRYVAPTFAEIFADFETRWYYFDFFVASGTLWKVLALALIVVNAILAGLLLRRFIRGRPFGTGPLTELFLWLALYLPGLGVLVKHHCLVQPVQVLSLLVSAGIPLDEALERAGETDTPRFFRRAFERLARRVRQGDALGDAANKERLFPVSLQSAMVLGVESGLFAESLSALGARYRRESLKWARVAVDVFLPLSVLIIGVLTLLVHVAFFGGIVALFEEGANWV